MAKKKKNPWMKKRHRLVTELIRYTVGPYCKVKYGLKLPRRKELLDGQYLILLNHQTPMDQFFIGMFFKNPVYYVATEDIFSNGIVSSLIRFLIAPIPIKKQTTDPGAVMNCIRVAREGGSICIAPEGNRTYSGKTEYMNPAIGALAKKMGLPVVLVAIDGGYGMEPRWSDTVRRGSLSVKIRRIISPEEAKAMTADEMLRAIEEGVFVNEACRGPEYPGKNLANYLERVIYICPNCGLSHFESNGDHISCSKCGRKTKYNADKTLSGENWDCPFTFVNDWYEYQKDFVNSYDVTSETAEPLYTEKADLYRVNLYKNKEFLEKGTVLSLYGDCFVLGERVLPFEKVSVAAVLGRNKLNIYFEDRVYQLKGSKRFNALKYVQLFYRAKNIMEGDNDGKFLGL